MRALAYACHVVAVVALLSASRRAPSLRRAAWCVLVWLLLSPVRGFDRDDGRALYHVAQAAEMADHALLLWLLGAPRGAALGALAVAVVACVAWWPLSAAPLYAAAQGVTVVACVALLAMEARRARAPLPGHLAAVVLVAGELVALVAPYALAVSRGTTVAAEWDAALVVRAATWGALAVVGWQTWRSALPWHSAAPALRRARGPRGAATPRSGSSEGGKGGGSGNEPGARL